MSKVALITGAARGIGYDIAKSLAKEKFHLAINDIVEKKAVTEKISLLEKNGITAQYFRADVSVQADRQRMLAKVQAHFGTLNLLVNNAGVAPKQRTDILNATEESFDRVLSINLKGPYFLTREIAKWMVRQKQKNPDDLFCIINISSSNSVAVSVNRGEYCVSKAGVSMATKLWAVRLAEFGIPVYEIRPGIIETPMTEVVKEKYDRMIEKGLLLQKRWGRPEDVGKAVAMLARGDLPYSTGQVLYVDGGQLIPRL